MKITSTHQVDSVVHDTQLGKQRRRSIVLRSIKIPRLAQSRPLRRNRCRHRYCLLLLLLHLLLDLLLYLLLHLLSQIGKTISKSKGRCVNLSSRALHTVNF